MFRCPEGQVLSYTQEPPRLSPLHRRRPPLPPPSLQGSQGDDKKPINTLLNKVTPILETVVKTTGHKRDEQNQGHEGKVQRDQGNAYCLWSEFHLGHQARGELVNRHQQGLHVELNRCSLKQEAFLPAPAVYTCVHLFGCLTGSMFSPFYTLISITSALGHHSHFVGGEN